MRTLRVGVDAWGMSGDAVHSGMGQYTASLLTGLPRSTPIEMVAYGAPGECRPPWLPGEVRWEVPKVARTGRLSAIASRSRWLPSAVLRDGIDVFHVPGLHVRPSSPPVPSVRCPLVVTIHDVIPLSYYGAALPPRNRWFYSWNLRRGLKADRVLTVSESAKEEIARYTSAPEDAITVITSAVDFAPNDDPRTLRELGIEGAYFLYAGSYEPRKNLLGMLTAFDRFRQAGGAHSLIALTERSSGHASDLHAALARLPCRDAVRLVHGVPDAQLRALYTQATAVVFPSLAEGLGLPAIQAAACGVPVIASDLPALRETVGDLATFVRPGDTEGLSQALRRTAGCDSHRAQAAQLGRQIASRYSPERCASEHSQVYRSIYERRHAFA